MYTVVMGNINKTLGLRLRGYRKRAGYPSAEDFAEALGVHHNTVYCLERGEQWISPELLDRIATLLDFEPGYLFSDMKEPPKPSLKEAISVISELLEKLGPTLIARLAAMDKTEIAALETALSERPISDDSTMSESNQEHEPKHDHGKRRNK